jgi:penicillin amidase
MLIIGRNARVGWGFTNTGTDMIDYLILEINPQNPDQYKLDEKWVDFKIIKKIIKIKGKADIVYPVKVSRFGPVLQEGRRFYARHSVMQYPSTILDAFQEMNFSRDIDEFIAGLKKFSSPAQNVVMADNRGNIAYFPTGLIPKRRTGTGAFPIRASRSTDIWEGFYTEEEKPLLINPEKGYVVTANNPVIPENQLPLLKISFLCLPGTGTLLSGPTASMA